jgi:hypothetical protein
MHRVSCGYEYEAHQKMAALSYYYLSLPPSQRALVVAYLSQLVFYFLVGERRCCS